MFPNRPNENLIRPRPVIFLIILFDFWYFISRINIWRGKSDYTCTYICNIKFAVRYNAGKHCSVDLHTFVYINTNLYNYLMINSTSIDKP